MLDSLRSKRESGWWFWCVVKLIQKNWLDVVSGVKAQVDFVMFYANKLARGQKNGRKLSQDVAWKIQIRLNSEQLFDLRLEETLWNFCQRKTIKSAPFSNLQLLLNSTHVNGFPSISNQRNQQKKHVCFV